MSADSQFLQDALLKISLLRRDSMEPLSPEDQDQIALDQIITLCMIIKHKIRDKVRSRVTTTIASESEMIALHSILTMGCRY